MRWRIFATLFFLTIWAIPGQVFADSNNSVEESKLRQDAKNYSNIFGKGDARGLAQFWTEDAVYINPTSGESVKGRAAIIQEYTHWFNQLHANKTDISIEEISFPHPDEAVERGFSRIQFSDGKPPIEHAFSAHLVRENGRWLFKEVRQIPLKSQHSNHDKLKPLEWLIGSWVDADKDVTISFDTHWDKYKNLLIQNFDMKLYGQDIIEGRQIIAWDPIEKRIRSWVFDSDGGFGQGSWYEKDGSLFAKMAYTLADGRKASAVNIYKRINGNSYSWSSVSRDVNGEILPNIEPVIVERQEEQR